VWCAEFEDAPSRVLEARFPNVPNLHDVTKIPWHIVQPVDVLTAGYPCQPFSLAGARKGEEDSRHLWPSIADAIRVMRPQHVLLENVRGHLSLGFDRVILDLHQMGYAVSWRILSAAAVGACHRRERLWIYATPAEDMIPVEGRVLAVAGESGWNEPEVDLFGERLPWRGKLPTAGMMHSGEIRAVTMQHLSVSDTLFPTPNASVSNDGEGPRTWLARREKSKRPDHGGNGMPLTIAVQLLPTPEAKLATSGPDFNRANRDCSGGDDLATALVLLPTPDAYQAMRGGSQPPEKRRAGGHTVSLADVVEKGNETHLLPTPKAGDASFGLPRTSGRAVEKSTHLATRVVYDMLPTPRSSRGASSTEIAYALGADCFDDDRTQGEVVFTRPAEWGKYAHAVERHAAMLDREPESPTQPNMKGNPELSPKFVEWMMCLPEGWVTGVTLNPSLSPRGIREAQLKLLGNGVVPAQALYAFQTLAHFASEQRSKLAA
jgi:DNA (cytosine-5)-methyltransferase 1